ncbi:PLP-dependent aminotransferase family protein [Roseibium limicola]|uniref:PLP-dependent aminotransferase family protein n=1 Tax=Roseibium limicola TaxID=2816037 RepID=A0A939EJS2_9HYPH|nr:PLP-dependent aminotransferase family protein [Roseibium limicola]MBO0343707.1 PLP-dependent aminotransferase family protein [Roseibium limicola]
MSIPVLPEGLVRLDRSIALPLSQQIYRSLREAVRGGKLLPGRKLPSSRQLAEGLGVARSTVNAALELLQAEQIIVVRPGAATVIAREEQPEGAPSALKIGAGEGLRHGLSSRGRLQAQNLRGEAWPTRHGALQPGAPALDVFPHDLWARSLRRAARRAPGPELLYQAPTGHPELRRVLAEYLAVERGVKATSDQIIVTCGMQAALSALSQAMADPGDLALLEDPGYLGARTAFHGAGLRIAGLPVDGQGADVRALTERPEAPKLIYVTPSHHYPLGTRMPLRRRLALLEAVRTQGGVILEDDYDSEFLFEGRPVAALQGLARAGEVIYLGTFSKSFLPGLRLSYCVVPEALAEDLRAVFRHTGKLANVHAQIALADFIESGEYRAHLKRIRLVYQERGGKLVEALKARLGNRINVEKPTGNVQVTLSFSQTADDLKVASGLQEHGYAVSPLSPCYVDRPAISGLIVGFAAATDQQIEGFVDALSTRLAAGHG